MIKNSVYSLSINSRFEVKINVEHQNPDGKLYNGKMHPIGLVFIGRKVTT